MYSAAALKAAARAAGFAACGIAPAQPVAAWRRRAEADWLHRGLQADMHYLLRHHPLRADVRAVVPGARSVVSLALAYCPPQLPPPDAWRLARYAYGRDYHDVMRQRLTQLMAELGLEGRAFCDTAPIDERYWAWRCGLGWLGRHTQLILPRGGTYFFLGELVLTDEPDAYTDHPLPSRCGTCRACISACPTGALSPEGELDARRCLSYQTIERRGPLSPEARSAIGSCIYGCDRCAEACPWNRFAPITPEPDFQPTPELLAMRPPDWLALTPERYRQLFKGSAVKRAKYEGLMRNIRAAAGIEETDEAPPAPSAPTPDAASTEAPPALPND